MRLRKIRKNLTLHDLELRFRSLAFFCLLIFFSPISNASGAASLSYIDNVGFGAKEREQLSDIALSLQLSDQYVRPIGLLDKLSINGSLNIKAYKDHPYNHAWLPAGINYQKKLGVGFYKPRIAIDWTASRRFHEYDEDNSLTSTISLA